MSEKALRYTGIATLAEPLALSPEQDSSQRADPRGAASWRAASWPGSGAQTISPRVLRNLGQPGQAKIVGFGPYACLRNLLKLKCDKSDMLEVCAEI